MLLTPCRALVRLVMIAALVPFVLVGRPAQSAPSHQSTAVVFIQDFRYHPATLTVAVGTIVTWTNRDPVPHTATSRTAGKFDTGLIEQNQSKSVTLTEVGTFDYFCTIHPDMRGTITVTASSQQTRVFLPLVVS